MDERTASPEPLLNDTSSQRQPDQVEAASRPVDLSVSEAAPKKQLTFLDSPGRSPAHSTTQPPKSTKPLTLCVYTLKPSTKYTMMFASGRQTTTQQIMDQMLTNLGMPNELQNVFSIWLTSKYLQLQLKPHHLPCKLFKRWKDLLSQYTSATYEEVTNDEPILSFQRNAFFSLKEERKLLDPKLNSDKAIDLLFHEAVFNVTKARYPMTKDDFHDLAGLQAAIKAYETFDKTPNPANYHTKLSEFYPAYMVPEPRKRGKLFKQKPTEGKDTPDMFTKSMRAACAKSTHAHQLKILYLQICWHKPFYGAVFFRGQIKKPFKPVHLIAYTDKAVTVAINADCFHLFSASQQPETLLYLMYDQLSWELQSSDEEGEDFYSSLWVEFDSVVPEGEEEKKVAKRIQVFSRQAPMMDAMISRCVAEIDKREEMLRQLRVQQGNEEFLPEVSIKTPCAPGQNPRVQRQERNFKEDKLDCEVYSEDGSLSQTSGFTLSRVLKKRKAKPPSPQDTYMVNPTAAEGAERDLELTKDTSNSQASQDSDHSLTTAM